jgi:hypothetical protein
MKGLLLGTNKKDYTKNDKRTHPLSTRQQKALRQHPNAIAIVYAGEGSLFAEIDSKLMAKASTAATFLILNAKWRRYFFVARACVIIPLGII